MVSVVHAQRPRATLDRVRGFVAQPGGYNHIAMPDIAEPPPRS
jgi:hypothetical protein